MRFVQTFFIEGMECKGCAKAVQNALEIEQSIKVENVSLKKKVIIISSENTVTIDIMNRLLSGTKYVAKENI
ncbi:cation transporter [Enterococcus avium]|jgi:copper chaperone CopZ|uniref:Cation transporter n=1 Tax=Enterococcus avium TaxID=33945 RepID=A0AAW8RN35_ENTAV|nr:cation transporter [Enterococcus avium]REC32962.1 copper resistance protein CopZ [Enterococcus pseudoavium]MDT2388271.1 cation transporter [Enterococcus avium]MDT2401427.1 cation transporter [Enterococcus avium]MDT2435349.1 cation transporter [Enterococcus avium]MDT2516318.1 cation transporter [Enterococcus avium]